MSASAQGTASPGGRGGHRTSEQRDAALARANEVKLARARLRAAIARGDVFAASVLLEVPPETRTWEVGELLRSQPHWAQKRAHRLLIRCMISERKLVGELTERQRRLLAGQLEGKR